MARNRVIYQSESVYVSQNVDLTGIQTGDNDIAALHRIQNANYAFNVTRQDVNQFGELASIDRIITEAPTISFDTNYYLSNLGNENKLGFSIWASGVEDVNNARVSCISGIVDSTTNDGVKNYFIVTSTEGADAVDNTDSGKYASIIGIGNASITSYSTEGAVGGMPTASIGCEGQNMNFVNVPYTGAYAGYTGFANPTEDLPLGEDIFDPSEILGFGFQTVGDIFIGITGAYGTTDTYSAGANRMMTIVGLESGIVDRSTPTQTPKGLPFTLPQGYVFKSNDTMAQTTPVTVTLEAPAEKGASVIYATIANGTITTPVVGPPYFIPVFTGTQAYNTNVPVVAYISGSNPSVDPVDGVGPEWLVFSGNNRTNSNVLTGDGGLPVNIPPVKLPVPTQSLTTSGTNITGALSCLRPGDITFTLSRQDGEALDLFGSTINDAPIQSYTIGFDLGRTPIGKLGSRYAFARPVDFPVTVNLSVDALVTDITTGAVADIVDLDTLYDATIKLQREKDNDPTTKETVITYEGFGFKMDSQSYTSSVGDNKSITFDFSSQIGGPEQTGVGLFMSGYCTGDGNSWVRTLPE